MEKADHHVKRDVVTEIFSQLILGSLACWHDAESRLSHSATILNKGLRYLTQILDTGFHVN